MNGEDIKHKDENGDAGAQSRRMMPNLPIILIENDILPRLPPKPLVRFSGVSKSWQSLLTNPEFLKNYLKNNHGFILQHLPLGTFYNVSYDNLTKDVGQILQLPISTSTNLRTIGSSNGILCLTDADKRSANHGSLFYLWNPATLQHKIIPSPTKPKHSKFFPPRNVVVALGFGFYSDVNDYKIIRVMNYGCCYTNETELYSLRTNSWRRVGAPPFCTFSGFSQASVNATLNWLGCFGRVCSNKQYNTIVSFDLDQERFNTVPFMDHTYGGATRRFILSYKGCLSMFVTTKWVQFDVWVMKEYGVKESWSKEFVIEQFTDIKRPLQFSINGEVLFEMRNGKLVLYDLESGKTTLIYFPGVLLSQSLQNDSFRFRGEPRMYDAVSYLQNLVSLGSYNVVEDQ